MNNAIEIQGLYKRFGEVQAVQDLNFHVKKGELFAFLGVNGAGKSTTISILCGQLAKDSGRVYVDGLDMDTQKDKAKVKLGVVFQQSVLDAPLTVRENLQTRGALYGLVGKAFEERLTHLAELLDFADLLNRKVGKLSGGQRRRIDIARALLHQPEILILDEPTTGLDPQTRQLLWQAIEQLRANRGMTVLLTTHYMEEAADADYVVILDQGSVVAKGTPLELKNTYTRDKVTLYGVTKQQAQVLGCPCEETANGCILWVPRPADATQMILAHPHLFSDFEITKGKMDDVFLTVTGKLLTGGEKE